MDDPWGSPWAADSPAKIELPAAPQNAHFSADHLFPRGSSRSATRSRSPGWEDDDAWGGWNGGAATDGGGSGKESPGWGKSPGLKPLQVAPSLRSLSPDPWKEVALKRLDTTRQETEERKPRAESASETSGDDRVVDSAISFGEEQELQKEKDLKSEIPAVVPSLDIDVADDGWRVEVTPETPEAPAVETVVPAILLEHSDLPSGTARRVLDAGRGEEKDELLVAVDEPVWKEDPIAPPTSTEVEEEQPTTAIEVTEDAIVVLEPEVIQSPLSMETEVVTQSQQQRQESQDETPKPPVVGGIEDLETPATTFESEAIEHPASPIFKYSVISYPIDLAKLDDLFPSTPAVTAEAELVPDVIIDDTFALSSERKAWYQISRFGSKRKHDLGDDENYVRIGWSGSQIRERTTQTVRRWMEEDSITGRVVLGRRLGGSGAVMFNWNSPAPPVEIGEFLGRHSRNSSLNVKSAVPSPTTSSFGWGSSLPSSPVVARHPLANEIQDADAQESQSPKEREEISARQSLSLEPPPIHTRAHAPAPIKIPPTLGMNQDEEDGEDDWGEMMTATPTDTISFTEDEETASDRHGILPQSAFQFDTVLENPQLVPPNMKKAASRRPFSWHVGQTLSKPFKRGAKTPLKPAFPSPLSKPGTPPQVTPIRHAHTMSASASPVQSSPLRSSLSAEDEETVAKLLGDIPDLTYMLR
ncbi:hypothetical protein V8C37DRAFT_383563 [Trichoderma ceciliae]